MRRGGEEEEGEERGGKEKEGGGAEEEEEEEKEEEEEVEKKKKQQQSVFGHNLEVDIEGAAHAWWSYCVNSAFALGSKKKSKVKFVQLACHRTFQILSDFQPPAQH